MRRTLTVLTILTSLPAAGLLAADGGSTCDGEIVVTADGFEGEIALPSSPDLGLGLSDPTQMTVVVDTESASTADVAATVTIDWANAHNDHDLYVYDEEGNEYVGGKFNFVGGEEAGEPVVPVVEVHVGGSYEQATTAALDHCEALLIDVYNYDALDPEATATLTIELDAPAS